MQVFRTPEAFVRTGTDEYEVLVFAVYLLQLPDTFESDKIHPVLIGAENSLGFDSNFHKFFLWR